MTEEHYKEIELASKKTLSLDPKNSVAWANLANAQVKLCRYQEAIQSCEKCIAIDPNLPFAWGALGFARHKTGDLAGALKAFEKAIELGPREWSLWANLSQVLEECKRDLPTAVQLLFQATSIAPNNDYLWLRISNLLSQSGRFKAAKHAAKRTIDLNSRNSRGWNNYGYAKQGLRDFRGAIHAYKMAIQLDPKDPLPLINLGILYMLQKETEEAFAQFKKATEVDQQNPFTWLNLGWVKLVLGNIPEAIAASETCIRIDPKMALAYMNMGVAKEREKNLDEARKYFEKGVELRGKDVRPLLNLANFYKMQGNPDKSLALLTGLCEESSPPSAVWLLIGEILKDRGQIEEALYCWEWNVTLGDDAMKETIAKIRAEGKKSREPSFVQKFPKVNPRTEECWIEVGCHNQFRENYGKAIAAFKQALKIKPNSSDPWGFIGDIHSLRGDWGATRECFKNALFVNPLYVHVWSSFGALFTKEKKTGEAFYCWQRAASLGDPRAQFFTIAYKNARVTPYMPKFLKDFTNSWKATGKLHEEMEDWDVAIQAYSTSIKADPKDVEVWVALANIYERLGRTGEGLYCSEHAAEMNHPASMKKVKNLLGKQVKPIDLHLI